MRNRESCKEEENKFREKYEKDVRKNKIEAQGFSGKGLQGEFQDHWSSPHHHSGPARLRNQSKVTTR